MFCVYLAKVLRMKQFINPVVEPGVKSNEEEKPTISSNSLTGNLEIHYLINKLERMDKCLQQLMGNTNEIKENEDMELKWKFAALVMDRSFFYATLIYFIVTFIALVMSSPNFYMGSG